MRRADSTHQSLAALTVGALGIVYGDIGTSPLYAAKEVFNPAHGIEFNAANVIGGISAIFWALMIVVSIKYVILIMRAGGADWPSSACSAPRCSTATA